MAKIGHKLAFLLVGFVLNGLGLCFAQFNVGFTLNNDIPVLKGSDTIGMAWAGGLNNPQFSSLSYGSTGQKKVVFTYDRDGNLTKAFEYDPSTGKMHWVPYLDDSVRFESLFPDFEEPGFCILRDFNGDGKQDIFTQVNYQEIAVYTNIGSTYPEFELENSSIQTKNGSITHPIRISGNQIPVILDLDNDEDLDIMFFASNLSGQQFGCPTYATFANKSVEDFGTLDELAFAVSNRCWGKITPTSGTAQNNWKPFDCDTTCVFGGVNRNNRDITGTQALHDLNGDGKLDLLVTWDHNDEMYAMFNIGTNEEGEIDISLNDDDFPANDQQVKLSNQPYPYFIDIDHDGDDDMLVGSNHYSKVNSLEYDTSGTIITDQFYRNNGSNSNPVFELEKHGYISGEMIDAGFRSFPAFGDLTGDGLPDLVIGNSGYSVFNPDLSPAFIQYYKNVGTENEPILKLVNTNLGEVNLLNLYIAHPTLGDLDDDGDIDMVVGDGEGYIHIYENTGTPNALYFELLAEKYKNIHLQGEAHPQLFDMNRDGLLDLIVGDGYGKIHYFENDGTDTEFDYDQNPTITNMGGINVYNSRGGMTCPYFTRNLDSTDLLYLFIGTENGIINGYGPIDNFSGEYTLADSIVLEARQTSVTGLNLFGNSRDELCIGQRTGGLYLLNRTKDIPFGIRDFTTNSGQLKLFPNPTHDQAQLKLRPTGTKRADLLITDLQGNTIISKEVQPTNGYYTENIDLRNYPRGVYLVSVIENDAVSWAKLILE